MAAIDGRDGDTKRENEGDEEGDMERAAKDGHDGDTKREDEGDEGGNHGEGGHRWPRQRHEEGGRGRRRRGPWGGRPYTAATETKEEGANEGDERGDMRSNKNKKKVAKGGYML